MRRLFYFSLLAAALFFSLLSDFTNAQENFYYSREEKIPLTIADKISIRFKNGVTQAQIQEVLSSEPALGGREPLELAATKNFFIVSLKSPTDVKQLVRRLKDKARVDVVNPVYLLEGLEAVPFDHFVVQFKPSVTPMQIDALNRQHHVETINACTAAHNLYTLRVTSASDLSLLEMAKLYYETLPS